MKVGHIRDKIQQYWNEDHQYDEIILHVGTNDLVHEKPEKVAEMEALINTVKAHTENIVVSSVVKRYDNKVNARDISHYNHLLHKLCTKYNIAFIDNDCIDQPFLNRSNLHLNKNGDRALGSAFCTYLKQYRTINYQSKNTSEQFFQLNQGPKRKQDWMAYLRYVHRHLHQ